MSINEVFMPALSSTMTEGKIVSWVKSPGDKVEKGETVVVVESDKADMDVETFYEGYLAHIIVPAGETAPVGAAIAYIAETEAEIATAQSLANADGAAAPSTPACTAACTVPSVDSETMEFRISVDLFSWIVSGAIEREPAQHIQYLPAPGCLARPASLGA